MTIVNVAGQDLHVIDRGSGDAVVFLHAFPFNASMWEYQYAALEATHRVIGIDLPGFGSSPAPADPDTASMADWADLVKGVIDELDLVEPTVVAASMGGYLTFEILRRHKGLLGDLVLVATRPKSDDVDTWQQRTDRQEALKAGDDTSTIAKTMVDGLLSNATLDRPEIVEYVLALMTHNTPEGWIAALGAMKNRPDAMSALKGLGHRTLVVAGELDRITPLSDSTLITRLVSDGRLVTISDAAHLPNLENPLEFNEQLLAFLNPDASEAVDGDGDGEAVAADDEGTTPEA